MQFTHSEQEPLHALRIEGRKWVNDISLEQVWAILNATFQEFDDRDELLFMVQLPSGEQPALCINKQVFHLLIQTPAQLAQYLRRRARETGEEFEDTTPPRPAARLRAAHPAALSLVNGKMRG